MGRGVGWGTICGRGGRRTFFPKWCSVISPRMDEAAGSGTGSSQHHSKASSTLSKQRPVRDEGDNGEANEHARSIMVGGNPAAPLHDTDLKANCARVELPYLG